jgi:beta-lactamase regulating signal transducer with metallopeptidase domain
MLCILYVNVISACLGIAAMLLEQVLPPGASRRWIWCAVIPMSLFFPGYYSTHHNWSVVPALEHQSVQSSLVRTLASGPVPMLSPDWWAHTQSYDLAINRVWLFLSAVIIALTVANAWRVWRIVRLSSRRADSLQPTIVDGVRVIITDAVGPATVGVVRSQVLVPRWVMALPSAQRQYVLRHEAEHRKSNDGLLLFVASLPIILAPWNLGLWWYLRRLCLAVEMDCDKRVVGALGDAHAYGELLLRVAEAGNRGPRLQPAFLGAGMLERRITQLVARRPLRRLQRVFAPAVIVGLLALVVWMPHPIPGHSSHVHSAVTSAAITATASAR